MHIVLVALTLAGCGRIGYALQSEAADGALDARDAASEAGDGSIGRDADGGPPSDGEAMSDADADAIDSGEDADADAATDASMRPDAITHNGMRHCVPSTDIAAPGVCADAHPDPLDALAHTVDGDVVILGSGTYTTSTLLLTRSIWLSGGDSGGGLPVIDGMGAGPLVQVSASNVRISNLVLRNQGMSAGAIMNRDVAGTLYDVWIEHCTIEDSMGTGVYFNMGASSELHGLTVTNNIIRRSMAASVAIYGGTDTSELVVTGNCFETNALGLQTGGWPVDATGNYWGSPDGPGSLGADTATGSATTTGYVSSCSLP